MQETLRSCPATQEVKKRFVTLNNYLNDEKNFFDESSRFLEFIRDEKLLPAIIFEVLNDNEYLNEVSSNSYKHVNHFSKIVLINDENQDNCRLTLHIWKPPFTESEISQELIHDHRFSFSSYVLCGEQVHEIVQESKDKSITKVRFQKYKYLPSNTGNIHDCFFEEDVYLDEIAEKKVSRGQVYTMHNEEIHRIVFPEGDEPIISFLVRGPRKRNYTHTYNTFYPREGMVSNVPMYTPNELRELLVYTLDKI
ncbi:hypothetical protein [Erwinia piriflorinigrans]|uniref:Uncharacterized protein n=1 Tax=Erwinia piriflorinigrans CFBP 5888 TaxID=1161919 RepID=V5Z4G3_9GAMM|nr:hypothetical protein [Erwinia piriflorinigrans]CCG86211.1 hypothetical protein EPIR_0846 [Erwinia piriflorinigrans CFBP 5888]